jgi:hypothetical protein
MEDCDGVLRGDDCGAAGGGRGVAWGDPSRCRDVAVVKLLLCWGSGSLNGRNGRRCRVLFFWLLLMTLIWLFLLGWAHVITGTFSPTEIAMTVTVGVASIVGIAAGMRGPSPASWVTAIVVMVLMVGLEVLALRVSLLPEIAHR